jgi:hypothetical protein
MTIPAKADRVPPALGQYHRKRRVAPDPGDALSAPVESARIAGGVIR